MSELHINVGLIAMSRGLLTLEKFAQGMTVLAASSDISIRDLWLTPGWLDEKQLAVVLDTVGSLVNRDTMLHSSGTFSAAADAQSPQVSPSGTIAAKAPGTEPTLVPSLPLLFEAAAPVRKPAATGELIGGRYRRLHQLGAGGLGEVSACEDDVLGRTVALKSGHGDTSASKAIIEREGRVISQLEHPNIVPIYDAGADAVRGQYYVMRQVTDTSLEAILLRRHGDPNQYSLNRLLRYFVQICNAVDYAHHRGVIHCDIKPANILLGDYGEVLLVDWGLAQASNLPVIRGGTPGYMAPEQMNPATERFDARTDVFALGAILYEILVGRPAFPEIKHTAATTVGSNPLSRYRPPRAPSEVARDAKVIAALKAMPEIEDTCMLALALDRERRLASARLLADAIDELIEGTKLKERRRVEADNSADTGDELAARYHEFAESRIEKLVVFRRLRADIAPWASTDDKQDLWDSEDLIRVTDALQVRTLQSAVVAYERALESEPGHSRARRGLARLYGSELRLARKRRDELHEIQYEQLLREVDDGEFGLELARTGTLELAIAPDATQLTLGKLAERDRRLTGGSHVVLPTGSTHQQVLVAGSYVLSATFGSVDHRTIAWPVNIEPGGVARVSVELPVGAFKHDEVVVPGGVARLGGDSLATEADEPFTFDVPTFVIQRFPVTIASWDEFLHDLDRETAQLHQPPHMTFDTTIDPTRMPVIGISAESAEAFARWLSKRDGVRWRLPSEIEWEKAGRGTDGRIFPWGDHFDATFCKMRDSRPGRAEPEPIGKYPSDVSPYGVCDLAGGVADWCIPDPRRTSPREPREVVSRGGSWLDWAIDCRLSSRRRHLATERSARVGLRLVRDI
jgi:serine/threonine-protein kinase